MTGQPFSGGGEEPQAGAAPLPGTAPGRPRVPRQPGRPDVFTFGETMVALRGSGPLKLGGTMRVSVAGAESNVAIGLARLGHDVRWAGAVGEDEAGQLVLRTLRAEGVEVSGAATDPDAPTGLLLFEPRLPEVTRVHYYRAGSAGSRLAADTVGRAFHAAPPRVLHLTGITPALSPAARSAALRALRLAREHGSLVCLDVNFRARLWTAGEAAAVLREWMPFVDVLIASDDELPLCLPEDGDGPDGTAAAAGAGPAGPAPDSSGSSDSLASPDSLASQARALLDLGVGEVVVKLGAAGATAFTCGGSLHRPARAVRAVDAVGAGDAFVAGYLSALLDGEGPAGCLERAVTTGAFAVASPGDWEGAPTRAELGMLGAPPGTVVR
ncbi:sugar kinase [Streptomyces angustmyceticus]|uniref:Ribokinase n=1 Tax=Streptomyces angustmyceticus TaxID=285578 RepID=A0A5J4LGE9_9ACTN|nr:sugar kinase [Streptomyces angustmyceticus]UAL69403.1 sugar kinase [Streptomyces angustmyceticus]GES29295.1 ribokinase [Streptomyces angustmyceticus]